MPRSRLGDSHNFGRHVSKKERSVQKPRTLVWEQLLLSAKSPLRTLLEEAAMQAGLGPDAFGLPDLGFTLQRDPPGGEVEAISLEPLAVSSPEERRALARLAGRAIALWTWLGVSDLHWENLVLGRDARGRVVFSPLDVEMILADLELPTETKLLPDADPEVAMVCRHAAGVRRLLPFLGKPIESGDLLAMARSYLGALSLLDKSARGIAEVFAKLEGLDGIPIRVLLRGTGDYVHASSKRIWPPLLEAEREQLARGDIPYFFRLYERPGIHYYADPSLKTSKQLPAIGDVPQLDPMLRTSKGFRSPTRKTLREEGLLTVLGAFDHKAIAGLHAEDGLSVTFQTRTLLVKLPNGEELSAKRDLRAYVGSVYLPCACGEVTTVFVPEVTVCGSK